MPDASALCHDVVGQGRGRRRGHGGGAGGCLEELMCELGLTESMSVENNNSVLVVIVVSVAEDL